MTSTPDLLYSDTETELAAALTGLLAERAAASDVRARTERPETYDGPLWHTVAAEIGVAGLLIPEPLGGAGASYRELATAAEAFGAAVAPIPYLGSAAVATATLLVAARSAASGGNGQGSLVADNALADDEAGFGSASSGPAAAARAAALRARAAAAAQPATASRPSPAAALLRQLADGTATIALAVDSTTAPLAPFPGAVRVAGVADAASGTVRLRGTIPAVADALPAGLLLVPAESVPSSLYLVEATASGVHRTPVTSLDMTRQLCDITLDNAEGRQIIVGPAAEDAVRAGLTAGAAMLAAEQLGLAQRCLDMTVAYVKERHQFGRPVGSFQAVKHRLADLWAAIAQARAASRYAAATLAAGGEDAQLAVALAKSACSEVAVTAAQECVQLHGGIGFTWEHPAHLYLKRAKAASLTFGAPAEHRAALASLANLPGPKD
jgi:alkylation response protein AidB-like acyl-CoA dehydrogenase